MSLISSLYHMCCHHALYYILAKHAIANDQAYAEWALEDKPGVSVKSLALHPSYEFRQTPRITDYIQNVYLN